MGENNAHLGETREHRLNRFSGDPIEIIETLLASIHSFFNNEIKVTLDNLNNPQTSLMILGVHSAVLTIAHGFWDKGGEQGYKLFLEHYMDGDTPDKKFSLIASEIHAWRNVIAHRWLNVSGHKIGYKFDMEDGWRKEGEVIYINPKVYLVQYIKAFDYGQGGMLYRYNQILDTPEKLESAKQRFLSKYVEEI